jgi:hypothetical protein
LGVSWAYQPNTCSHPTLNTLSDWTVRRGAPKFFGGGVQSRGGNKYPIATTHLSCEDHVSTSFNNPLYVAFPYTNQLIRLIKQCTSKHDGTPIHVKGSDRYERLLFDTFAYKLRTWLSLILQIEGLLLVLCEAVYCFPDVGLAVAKFPNPSNGLVSQPRRGIGLCQATEAFTQRLSLTCHCL